jgi:hypothetical protein
VLSEHTYRRRLLSVLSRIGLVGAIDLPASMAVMALTRSAEGARRLAEALRAQTLRPSEIVLVPQARLPDRQLEWWRAQVQDVPVRQVQASESAWAQAVGASDAGSVAFMDDRDHYGPDYLLDHALALEYAPGEFIGKQTFERRQDRTSIRRITPGSEFRLTRQVPSATLSVRRQACTQDVFAAILGSRSFVRSGDEILSIDRFNYLQNAHAAQGTAMPLDQGLRAQVEA